jgi:hypothetical protein
MPIPSTNHQDEKDSSGSTKLGRLSNHESLGKVHLMLLSIDTHFALRRDEIATGDIIVFVLVSSCNFPRGMMGSESPCKTARDRAGMISTSTQSVCGCGVYSLLHRFLFSTKEQNYESVANCHKEEMF